MSWKTNNAGITVPDWWHSEFPWRESSVYLPKEVDLESMECGWLCRRNFEPDATGNLVCAITGILGDFWVYPEESERVSEWFARCTRIYEMYATGAMSVLGQYKVSPEIDIPPEDWFQNGPGLWPEGQAET